MLENIAEFLPKIPMCFLLGSIPFAVVALAGSGIDIRNVGSGNPGFNNVLRVSKPRAVICLVGDMGKAYLAVSLFYQSGDNVALGWLYGFVVILGHCFSPFLKFKGGKGIATSSGVMLVLYPQWATLSLAAFFLIRVTGNRMKWREAGALASMSAWVVFVVFMIAFLGRTDAAYATLMTLFLAWRHRKNFQNLLTMA